MKFFLIDLILPFNFSVFTVCLQIDLNFSTLQYYFSALHYYGTVAAGSLYCTARKMVVSISSSCAKFHKHLYGYIHSLLCYTLRTFCAYNF